MSTVVIWGKYKNGKTEKIDETDNPEYLVREYRIAFGPDWTIWAGRKKDEPQTNGGARK